MSSTPPNKLAMSSYFTEEDGTFSPLELSPYAKLLLFVAEVGTISIHGGTKATSSAHKSSNLSDFILSGAGDDLIWAHKGNDYIEAGSGGDTVYGGSGDDLIFGDEGDDVLKGQSGNDQLIGGIGQDRLYGGSGKDSLWGGLGDDLLFGGNGDDTLYDDDGFDVLKGGEGDDLFVFSTLSEAGEKADFFFGQSGNDTLSIFNTPDTFELNRLLSDIAKAQSEDPTGFEKKKFHLSDYNLGRDVTIRSIENIITDQEPVNTAPVVEKAFITLDLATILLAVAGTDAEKSQAILSGEHTANLKGSLADFVSDSDGDPVIFSIIEGPAFGSISLQQDGSFTYTPNFTDLNYEKQDSFTYLVSDGVTEVQGSASLSIVGPYKPVAEDNATFFLRGGLSSYSFKLSNLGLVSDVEIDNNIGSEKWTIDQIDVGGNGSAWWDAASNQIFYEPGFFTYDEPLVISYRVSDGIQYDTGSIIIDLFSTAPETAQGTISFNFSSILPENDLTQSHAILSGEIATSFEGSLMDFVSDTDSDSESLSFSLLEGPLFGSISLQQDGSFTYTPHFADASYESQDSFTYIVSDGYTDVQGSISLSVVSPHKPVAEDNATFVLKGGLSNYSFKLASMGLISDVEIDNGIGSEKWTIDQIDVGGNGSASWDAASNQIFYQPEFFTYDAPLVISYRASDGFQYDTGSIILDLFSIPIAQDLSFLKDLSPLVEQYEGTPEERSRSILQNPQHGTISGTLANLITDPDGNAVSFALENGPSNGQLIFNQDGSFLYTPDLINGAFFTGKDTFTYKAIDQETGTETSATVSLTIASPYGPDAVDGKTFDLRMGLQTYSFRLETFNLLSDVEIDDGIGSEKWSITEIDVGNNGHAWWDAASNQIYYKPEFYIDDEGEPLSLEIRFLASDGSRSDWGSIIINQFENNTAPVVYGETSFSVRENQSFSITFGAKDAQNDAISFFISGGDDQDLFTIDQDTGRLSLLHPLDYETRLDMDKDGIYEVEISARDALGAESDPFSFSLSVQNVNYSIGNVTSLHQTGIRLNPNPEKYWSTTDGYGQISAIDAMEMLTGQSYQYINTGGSQWYMGSAQGVHSAGITGAGVTVAVIGTGVDYTHSDLDANIWTNSGEIAGNGRDDDGNGYTDDYRGWNFANNNSDVMDRFGHETLVAGVIASEDNGFGTLGWAPDASIMPVKVLSDSGSGSMYNVAQGIRYAVNNGADIINISLTGGYDASVRSAIQYAEESGILVVIAAGNDYSSSPSFMGSLASQWGITVGSYTQSGTFADYSNEAGSYGGYGSSQGMSFVAIAGTSILMTSPGNNYTGGSGTSFAAPSVSGLAALLLSEDPTLTPNELKTLIMNTTSKVAYHVQEGQEGAVIGELTYHDRHISDTLFVNDHRFEVIESPTSDLLQLKLRNGVGLDYEQDPNVRLELTLYSDIAERHGYTQEIVVNVWDIANDDYNLL